MKSQRELTPEERIKREEILRLRRELPFVSRRISFTDWVFKNKFGVSAVVFTLVAIFIMFDSIRFDVIKANMVEGFLIEVPVEDEPEKIVEEEVVEEKEPEKIEHEMNERVKNMTVNQNAKLDGGLKDDKGTKASDIYKEAQQVQDRMAQNKAAYEKGLQDEADINNNYKNQQMKGDNQDKREDTKVKGKVTVSYDLKDRNAVYLPVPAYKCEEGGEIVISITVNRNGDVIDAVVDKTSSTDNSCMMDSALSFAKKTKFNVSSDAPTKQKGTITYLFAKQ